MTIPEPTASVDAYRFIKLATIRESVTRIPTRNPNRRTLEKQDFERAEDLWTTVSAAAESGSNVQTRIMPWVIVNQSRDSHRSFERLRMVTRKFLEQDLRLLGEVPRSEDIVESVTNFLPVIESFPDSAASEAYHAIARKLDDDLIRASIARRATPSASNELPDLSRAPSAVP